jgi:ADP-ribosylglycohydrolase
VVRRAYLRWLQTQGDVSAAEDAPLDGWLAREPALHSRRAPGNTCLAALRAGANGTRAEQLNQSKGCGGVMRAAPAGLIPSLSSKEAFDLAADCAAITHGHPSGYLSAGALSATLRLLLDGESLARAVSGAAALLRAHAGHEEASAALAGAVELAAAGAPSPEKVESLGEGKVGEEALAIAVYCALAAPDPRSALLLAVNHSGDSDSTGAICGNLLGTLHGEEALPAEWLEPLELRAAIERLADDFVTEMTDPPVAPGGWGEPPQEWWDRYPGW